MLNNIMQKIQKLLKNTRFTPDIPEFFLYLVNLIEIM